MIDNKLITKTILNMAEGGLQNKKETDEFFDYLKLTGCKVKPNLSENKFTIILPNKPGKIEVECEFG